MSGSHSASGAWVTHTHLTLVTRPQYTHHGRLAGVVAFVLKRRAGRALPGGKCTLPF
jgi:hypothetical protein